MASETPDTNGWGEYQKLVMAELKRHNKRLEQLYDAVNELHVEVAMLKVKAGVWGLLGGSIPVAVLLAVNVLKN